jgi:hypothetical protein
MWLKSCTPRGAAVFTAELRPNCVAADTADRAFEAAGLVFGVSANARMLHQCYAGSFVLPPLNALPLRSAQTVARWRPPVALDRRSCLARYLLLERRSFPETPFPTSNIIKERTHDRRSSSDQTSAGERNSLSTGLDQKWNAYFQQERLLLVARNHLSSGQLSCRPN